MKKLLITSMAAVAVSICAKATETSYNTKESFEGYTEEGPLFGRQEENAEAYKVTDGWVTTATPEDGIFTVTKIANYVGAGTHETVSRPITDTPNVKALAIDTSNPLMRTVHTATDSSDALGEAVFFDSVVQFTATDAKPTPGNDDKLMVWLYASDDVDNDNPGVFGETTPTTNLIITAGYYESGDYVVTNYMTGVEIAPDSWHRLTIKSFKDSGYLKFNVWVDETLVEVGTESDFISLQYASGNADMTLKGVAFDGKGAVDDLVFTTTDPFAVPSYEITVKLSDDESVCSGLYKAYSINGGNDFITLDDDTIVGDGVKLTLPTTVETILFKMVVAEGYKIDGENASRGEATGTEGYYWTKTVTLADIIENGVGEISLAIVEDDGTEDPITTYTVSVTPNAQAIVGGLSAEYAEGNVVTFTVVAVTGYTIEGVAVAGATTAPALTVNGDGYFFTMPAEAVMITVTTKAEEVTYPSVGGVDAPEYSDNAKKAIDAAFPGNSYPTDGLTVKVNGETLTGALAVAMLNDAVDMFTLAGDAKFFDADGVLDISFKATGADPDVVAYEAKVGGLAATVNESSYEVVPKYIDIATNDELQAKPEEGTVTFRLVIQKKK